ncbi:MAG: hypothetical protein AB7T10_03445 [bacterium]
MLFFQALVFFLNFSLAADTLSVSEKTDTVFFEKAIYDNSLMILSDNFILKSDEDYIFSKGKLIFLKNVSFPVKIIFEEAEQDISYSYKKFSMTEAEDDSFLFKETVDDSSTLFLNGLKSFFVSTQSGNVVMDQSLDVLIGGKLTDDWNVEGRIYDNTAEMNSATINTPISKLENLRIALYGPKEEIILGSSSFSGFSNEFSSFYREIFGIKASVKIKNYPLSISAAGQKGRFSSTSFYCTDGIQGPYKLQENYQMTMYAVAPESERIFLDGELLRRGEDNDYTINYFTGEIIFSPVIMVDGKSYVYAEFQTYEELTPVTGYFLKAGEDTSGLTVLFGHEDQSVSDEKTIELLKNIASDSSEFVISGAVFVGAGNGKYILDDSVFVFAGEGRGDYNVEFYYAGYGNGDYIYSPSNSCYVYAGESSGNYSAEKTLLMPFSSDYLSLSYKKTFPLGKLNLEGSGGLYSNNRYSESSERKSNPSFGCRYESPVFSLGNISSDFSISGFSRSEIYREKWGSSKMSDEELFKILDKRSAGKELKFGSNFGYDTLFKAGGYYSLLDSSQDSRFSISSDTLFGFFASTSKRISYTADSLAYSSSEIKVGRSFASGVLYGFLEEQKRGDFISLERGGGTLLKLIPIKMEYSVEDAFVLSSLTKKTDIARLEFAGSWSKAAASVVSEYRSIEDISSASASDRLGLSSNLSLLFGHSFTSYSSFSLTSLSAYRDIDYYVYAGEGRGDYIYDDATESYIFDEVYGSYIKLTERAQSDEPAIGRKFSFNARSLVGLLDIRADIMYDDLCKSFFSIDTVSFTSQAYSLSFDGIYSLNNDLKPFNKSSLSSDFRESVSSGNSLSILTGIKGDKVLPYSAGFLYTSDSQRYQTGYYLIHAKKGVVSFNASNERAAYLFNFSFGIFEGEYDFESYDSSGIAGRTLSVEITTRHGLSGDFSISASPYAAYNVFYRGDSSPLVIHYKYPEGASFSGKISLIFSNNSVNASLSYVGEFDEKYLFNQRIEASLLTYF